MADWSEYLGHIRWLDIRPVQDAQKRQNHVPADAEQLLQPIDRLRFLISASAGVGCARRDQFRNLRGRERAGHGIDQSLV